MAYTGMVAEIPVAFGGLTGNKNQTRVRPDQLIVATNIAFDTGNLTKEGGAVKYNIAPIPCNYSVIGGWDWIPEGGVQRMVIFTRHGELLRDDGDGSFGTTLKSGLSYTGILPMFTDGGEEVAANNKKLFIFTGVNAVQVLSGDGATTSNLATPPADWSGAAQPTFGLIHASRLWAGGNSSDYHRLYYSTTASHEDFTGAGSGSLSVYPGEGEKLVGAISFKGLIIAWKFPKGIYLIDTSDADITKWSVRPLTRAVGGVSSSAMVMIDDDVMYLDASGNFQLISATTEFGDMASNNLSSASNFNDFFRANVNFSYLHKAQAVYYSFKREVHFSLPGTNSIVPNIRIVCDLNGEAPRFRYSNRDVQHGIWLRKDITNVLRPVIGSDGGFVYLLDSETKSKDGTAYSAVFQTGHLDMSWLDPSLSYRNKIGQFLELVVEPSGDWNLFVDVLWDNVLTDTVQFNMGVAGGKLGTFILGTDKLSGGAILNRREKISGEGRRLSLIGRNTGSNEDFSVSKFLLYFKPGDEKLRS